MAFDWHKVWQGMTHRQSIWPWIIIPVAVLLFEYAIMNPYRNDDSSILLTQHKNTSEKQTGGATDETSSNNRELAQDEESSEVSESNGDCQVAGIIVHGSLVTYYGGESFAERLGFSGDVETASDEVVQYIQRADEDPRAKAIFIEIDSGGGLPVAGEEIANALRRAIKPTVAVIRQTGASAAYWAASGADQIFASRNSDIGSIGVTMSYLDNVEQNTKDGLRYEQLSAGKFKDSGSPDKSLTDEERTLFMRDIKIVQQNFIEDVARNRRMSLDSVRAIADGSTVLGRRAKELKLIDQIGGEAEALEYLTKKLEEKAIICWVQED